MEYDDFVKKFEPKKTTDDCFTPPEVYAVAKEWAVREYGWEGREILRPFFPGGDYENYTYPEGAVVIDNPPFSIITPIARFYEARGISYFLFAPSLTLLCIPARSHIGVGVTVTYENGAKVNTSFVASEGARVRSSPSLYDAIKSSQLRASELPKYKYPPEVMTASKLEQLSRAGVNYEQDRAVFCKALDAQLAAGKKIYGGAFLVPPVSVPPSSAPVCTEWQLSERELNIIRSLQE